MSNERKPRILPFIANRDKVNQEIDREIMEQERSEEAKRIATKALNDLDWERLVKSPEVP